MSVGKQRLDVFPDPLSPSQTTHRRTCSSGIRLASLLCLRAARVAPHFALDATEHRDDALTIQQVKAHLSRHATGLATAPRARLALRRRRVHGHYRDGSAQTRHQCQHHHWTAKTAAATSAMRRSISARDGATSTTVRFSATWLVKVHPFASKRHACQIAKERLGVSYGTSVTNCAQPVAYRAVDTCHQPQRVSRGYTPPGTPTIKIRPLKLHRPHHGFDRAADVFSGLQHPLTPRTGNLGAVVLTTVDMRQDVSVMPGELLAQGPHRCRYLR